MGWAAALFLIACTTACEREPEARPAERFSLLALGDTGVPPGDHDGQAQVAAALADEDAANPVDGLVLLGDIFYPNGLEREVLLDRVAHNIVTPYCQFVAAGPRYGELRGGCPAVASRRTIWAVLGNHDFGVSESPDLQRSVIPEFVSNWHMNREVAEVVEAAPGVSLILVDTQSLHAGDPERLGAAVTKARGPWRILVGHHPFAAGLGDRDGVGDVTRAAAAAVRAAGVPVQLALSGHEHNLQALVTDFPSLQIISGGGSGARNLHDEALARTFGTERAGFARVALLETEPESLRVELIALSRVPWLLPPRRVATYFVSVDGTVSDAAGSRVSR